MGVCDSKSLVVTKDLSNKGLADSFLLELCRVKRSGDSLSKLGDFGRNLCFCCLVGDMNHYLHVFFMLTC